MKMAALAGMLVMAFTARAGAEELTVIAAKFGLVDYNQPGLRSGDFGIKAVAKIPEREKYFGWVIEVKCPAGAEQVDWVETTYLPGRLEGEKSGTSANDPTVTIAKDLKSLVTRRTAVCRDGVARLEDLYAREPGLPPGEWRVEVRSRKQLLAEFRFLVE